MVQARRVHDEWWCHSQSRCAATVEELERVGNEAQAGDSRHVDGVTKLANNRLFIERDEVLDAPCAHALQEVTETGNRSLVENDPGFRSSRLSAGAAQSKCHLDSGFWIPDDRGARGIGGHIKTHGGAAVAAGRFRVDGIGGWNGRRFRRFSQ